jgi:hypothetical protein
LLEPLRQRIADLGELAPLVDMFGVAPTVGSAGTLFDAIRHPPFAIHSPFDAACPAGLAQPSRRRPRLGGDYRQAMHVVEQLLRTGPVEGGTLYNLAHAVALSSASSARDTSRPLPVREKTAERWARRAVDLLRLVASTGHFLDPANLGHMGTDTSLAVLRDRVDFRRFMARLPAPARRSTR